MKSTNSTAILLAFLLNAGLLNAQHTNTINQPKNKEVTMTNTQRNKDVVQRIYDQALNQRSLELLNDLVSDDFVGIKGLKGVEGFQESAVSIIKAFPDARWRIVSLIGEENNVFIKWKLEGTHTGTFQNIAATNKTISSDGMGIYELKDGKVINVQIHTDRLGFLQQLGVLPEDLNLLTKKTNQERVRFVDTFVIPAYVNDEFMKRVKINREFIKKLPGFVEDAAFERKDGNGNIIFMTIAVWENEQAVQNAKEAVQAEYNREGFDPAELLRRLNITMDRGIFKEALPQ